MDRTTHHPGRTPRLLALLAITVAVLGGCAGWQTWPSPTGKPSPLRANDAATSDVIVAAMRWLVENRPPPEYEGPIAVNIPEGIEARHYLNIARRIGERVEPLTEQNQHLPTYHVVSVRIRAAAAQVTALRPAMEVEPGRWELEKYTITLEGGLKPWTVTRPRPWVGVATPPPLNFYVPPPTQGG